MQSVVIWLGIVIWSIIKECSIIKHEQVVLVPMLLRRITSILSSLGVIKGFIRMLLLVDPGATLYFVTSLLSMKIDMFADVLVEPFPIFITVADSVVAIRVYM